MVKMLCLLANSRCFPLDYPRPCTKCGSIKQLDTLLCTVISSQCTAGGNRNKVSWLWWFGVSFDVFPISSSWWRCLRTTSWSFLSDIFTPLLCGTNQGAWIANWLGTSGRLRCYVSDFAFFSAMTAARRSYTSTLQGVMFEPSGGC